MRILICNGRIIDPSQRIDAHLNLLAEDGKIICLTAQCQEADRIVDARGLVVSPGFIDMHAHEDPVRNGKRYDQEDKANLACLLRMGVTTCVAGNCGDNFCHPAEFLDLIDREGCYVNVVMLAGYTYFRERLSAAGRYSPASAEERGAICTELKKALDAGCAGISFGLEYVPGMDADELREAADLCSTGKKMIAAHIRGCADQALPAAREIMEAAERAGIPVEISHIGSMAAYGNMAELLKLIDEYRASGVDVCCDCYPYDAFSTAIGSAPYDDLESMHCRVEDIEMCEGVYRGRRCTQEIFDRERAEHPEYLTVGHAMKEDEIRLALMHPNVTLGSDCILSEGNGHPRAAGAFPRFLNRYVGEGGLSLFEALYKITAMPAERLKLPHKGTFRRGADADIVIFDPETIRDRSTFMDPVRAPEGIAAVFVAGQPAVADGKILNGRLGYSIRK